MFADYRHRMPSFLEGAIQKLGLSIRAWHRILRVSRTIADLAGHATIERAHLIEALGYRAMDRLLSRLRGASERGTAAATTRPGKGATMV